MSHTWSIEPINLKYFLTAFLLLMIYVISQPIVIVVNLFIPKTFRDPLCYDIKLPTYSIQSDNYWTEQILTLRAISLQPKICNISRENAENYSNVNRNVWASQTHKGVRNLTTMTVQHTSMIFFSLLIRDLTNKFSNNVKSIFHTFLRMVLYAHFI